MSQSKEQLRNKILSFLKEKDSGALATEGIDLRVSPVKYYIDEKMNIYIHSAGGEKFKNLEKVNKVCMLICTDFINNFDKIKGVQIFGYCEIGENGSSLYEEAERYCPWNHETDMAVIKLIPDRIIYKDGISEDGSKQTYIM